MRGKFQVIKDVSKLTFKKNGPRVWDSVQPGLCVQITPAGRTSFYVVLNGIKQSYKKIGDYPAMTLEDARKLASELRERAKAGYATTNVTNETLAQVWQRIQIEDTPYRGYALKTRRNMAQLYEKWVPIKSLPFSDINERHWLDTIDTALKAKKPGIAKTLKIFVGSFYRCANALPEYRTYKNPLRGISIYLPACKTKDALSLEEIRTVRLEDPTSNAVIQLCIATGLRISEVLRMRWDAIENDVWLVGGKGEMKNKASGHSLPMTGYMWSIVNQMKGKSSTWVFPNPPKLRNPSIKT